MLCVLYGYACDALNNALKVKRVCIASSFVRLRCANRTYNDNGDADWLYS